MRITSSKILISIGFIPLLISLFNYNKLNEYKDWKLTPAQVVNSEIKKSPRIIFDSDKSSHNLLITYRYSYKNKFYKNIENRKFKNKAQAKKFLSIKKNKPFNVYFNPKDISESILTIPKESNEILHITLSISLLIIIFGVNLLTHLQDSILIIPKIKNNKQQIILGFAFPNGMLIGILFFGLAVFGLYHHIENVLFLLNSRSQSSNIEQILAYVFILIFLLLALILGCLPLTSFSKIIINTKNKTIHNFTSLYNIFNDRKPVPYENFKEIKLIESKRKGSVEGLAHSTHSYKIYQTDILLTDKIKNKLIIKNVGDGEKGVEIANVISHITNIPFL